MLGILSVPSISASLGALKVGIPPFLLRKPKGNAQRNCPTTSQLALFSFWTISAGFLVNPPFPFKKPSLGVLEWDHPLNLNRPLALLVLLALELLEPSFSWLWLSRPFWDPILVGR